MHRWFFLVVLAMGDDRTQHYFGLLDKDENGGVDESEVQYFVSQMLELSGLGEVDIDDPDLAVDGLTLRQLIENTFDDIDANHDNIIHIDEAYGAQKKIATILGDFMSQNMPNSEF